MEMMRCLVFFFVLAVSWGTLASQQRVLGAEERPYEVKRASPQKEGPTSMALRMMEEVKKREAEIAKRETELKEREERLKVLAQELETAARELDKKKEELKRLKEEQETAASGMDQEGILRLAKLIDASPPEQGAKILSGLDPKVAAKVLSAMNQRKAGRFLGNLPPEAAVKIGKAMLDLEK